MARQQASPHRTDEAALKRRFGTAVRRHREQLGLTQRQLAARTKIARTYLADVERGARNPCLSIIVRIAEGLGLSLSMLFSTFEVIGTPSFERTGPSPVGQVQFNAGGRPAAGRDGSVPAIIPRPSAMR